MLVRSAMQRSLLELMLTVKNSHTKRFSSWSVTFNNVTFFDEMLVNIDFWRLFRSSLQTNHWPWRCQELVHGAMLWPVRASRKRALQRSDADAAARYSSLCNSLFEACLSFFELMHWVCEWFQFSLFVSFNFCVFIYNLSAFEVYTYNLTSALQKGISKHLCLLFTLLHSAFARIARTKTHPFARSCPASL